jgi:hypothetical protein
VAVEPRKIEVQQNQVGPPVRVRRLVEQPEEVDQCLAAVRDRREAVRRLPAARRMILVPARLSSIRMVWSSDTVVPIRDNMGNRGRIRWCPRRFAAV